ncbi:hypothetical protein, partial [Ideonella sp.]|uniref:hypothetical protein n=1 Tax=Ideonella sp. TaxID=1929293 RepID=UPI003BB593EA
AALLGWIWHADSGTAWLLRQLPMLTLQAPQGALGSGQFRTERLQLDLAAGQLVIEQAEIKGLDWTLRPHGGAWLGLSMQSLTGQTLRWQSHPSTTPSTPLESLELPVQVQIEAVQIASLTVDELPPLEGLDASLSLGNPAGSPHRIQLRALRSDRLAATGQLQLGAAAPMPVQAEFKLDSLNTEPAWNAKLRLDGPLARMAAVATLRGAALPGQAAPQADLDTVLQPFAPWPLGDLRLSAEALNLASLNSDWPETRLQIKAQLKSAGLDQPAQAELSLGNALAGRWDQQRLPIRSLSAQIGGTPEPLTELTLKQLAIDWGSAQATAGQWRGQGRYLFGPAQGSAELALTLSQWQPAALDTRMPGLLMSGPVKLSATALPAPGAATAGLPELSVAAKLTGRLLSQQGPQGSMTLNLDGQGTARKITLREADLRAEGSRLQATGTAEHQADGRWHWKAQGQVAELDLRSWWPGPADSEWQRQSQRLNASFSSQASVPASALQNPAKVLAQLRGELALQISQSAWAGVPLEGSARWSA